MSLLDLLLDLLRWHFSPVEVALLAALAPVAWVGEGLDRLISPS